MPHIRYEILTRNNFNLSSLDTFIRHQEVQECWRCNDGQWMLVANPFTENWDLPKLRSKAAQLMESADNGSAALLAFSEGSVVGFALVSPQLFGSENQYAELDLLHISESFRRQGIGRELFRLAADAARRMGAKKLYISAHSSRESQAAYRKMGCVLALEPEPSHVAAEPFDVQMEYML